MIAKERAAGDFLERLEQDQKRKALMRPRYEPSEVYECTFSPQINQKSKQLTERGFEAIGEKMRRESRMERLKQEQELRDSQDCYFSPKQFARDVGVESKLGVLRDPETLMERIKKEREDKIERVKQEAARQEKSLEHNLTFSPHINETPEFIHKMALAMRALREAANQGMPPKPPQPSYGQTSANSYARIYTSPSAKSYTSQNTSIRGNFSK
ncbi:MAG: hypothetical protein EZS28_004413 [Streblomastix strix]|uniref:Uncharacterized protein n=1 Tax=Streblomastix strix TaxID=222440 RepID=A0A5J4WYD7_9EUKA|nr:MAG: hypothetical protein EZS28_004413 [Streblomastix strix]